MKKIVMVIVAVALIAAGVFGTLAVQRTFEPSISLSSTSIQEQLSDCSELATAKLDYRGLVRYENGDIDFITKKAFTMVYDAEVRAGVDLAQARAEGKVNQANMLEQAKAQAHTLVENLLKPFTVGDNAYTVTVVDQ